MVAVVVLVVAVGILALIGYVVHRAKPTRFKLSAGVWKVLTLNVEVDSGPGVDAERSSRGRCRALTEREPKELPTGEQTALPQVEPKALPKGGDLPARLPGASRVHRGVVRLMAHATNLRGPIAAAWKHQAVIVMMEHAAEVIVTEYVSGHGYRLSVTITRQPLSAREGSAPQPAMREGVPDFVEEELRRWILRTASLDPDEAKHALIRLSLKLPTSYRHRYAQELEEARAQQAKLDAKWQAERDARPKTTGSVASWQLEPSRQFAPSPADPYARFLAEGTDTAILWDVADDLLHALCTEPLPSGTPLLAVGKRADAKRTNQIVAPLRRLLEESRSVYEIQPDQRGLQRRIDAALAETVKRVGKAAGSTGRQAAREHLFRARDKLFGLHPDPGSAYVEVILAVEEVACPLFLPSDPVPTLGKVRNHLRDAGTAYEYILPGKDGAASIAGVVGMLTDLWEGHSDRHGGGPRRVLVSQEAAEVAFTLAVSLITIFSTGAVRRRPV